MMNRYSNSTRAVAVSIGFACFTSIGALADTTNDAGPNENVFSVEWVGEMMVVHRDGDASPRTKLEPLARRSGGFAIGPIAGLRGEITVIEGKAYIARVMDGKEHVAEEWDVEAPFLVYGHADSWVEISVPEDVNTIAELETWLPKAAEANGIDPAKPFPFKIESTNSTLEYHVISNQDPGYKITRPHRELMKFHSIANEPVTLVGVHSTAHAGVFTHHGSSTHIHMVSDDEKHSGHLDAVTFGRDTKLLLPGK